MKNKVHFTKSKKVISQLIPEFLNKMLAVVELFYKLFYQTISRGIKLMHISNNIKTIVISFERAINRYLFDSSRLKATSVVAVCVKLI